jgi:hypothetical protein
LPWWVVCRGGAQEGDLCALMDGGVRGADTLGGDGGGGDVSLY